MPEKLILASASPRRRELLTALGVNFEVITADVTEHDSTSAPHLSPIQLATENARQKAQAVAAAHSTRFVFGADTVVALGNLIFGKPASQEQAADFLRTLSGHTHEVITGCALIAPNQAPEIFHDITRVHFRSLDDATVTRYLAAVHVLDKAGAYALQEHGDLIIERVDGSRSNVIGLPVEALEKVLHRYSLI